MTKPDFRISFFKGWRLAVLELDLNRFHEELGRMAMDRKCWRGFISQLLEEEDTHR